MTVKKEPRKSADAYGPPKQKKNNPPIVYIKGTKKKKDKIAETDIKKYSRKTPKIELGAIKKYIQPTNPAHSAPIPRTGPGSGGGGMRGLYSRLTGGGLSKSSR